MVHDHSMISLFDVLREAWAPIKAWESNVTKSLLHKLRGSTTFATCCPIRARGGGTYALEDKAMKAKRTNKCGGTYSSTHKLLVPAFSNLWRLLRRPRPSHGVGETPVAANGCGRSMLVEDARKLSIIPARDSACGATSVTNRSKGILHSFIIVSSENA